MDIISILIGLVVGLVIGLVIAYTAYQRGRKQSTDEGAALRVEATKTLEEAQTVEEACRIACDTLNENPFDISFSLIYLLDTDGHTAYLQEAVGIEANHKAVPQRVEIGTKKDVWKFDKILKAGRGQTLANIEKKFGRLAAGAWKDDWTREAFIIPLAKTGVQNTPAGFLICGISPRLKFDDEYHSFLELAAGHTATAIANARALEEERKRAEALAEIDRAKTEFFSNVSHEFRTPLTLMLGNLEEVLAQNGRVPAESREQIETAHRNSLRLLKLVNTLLDFSRIEAGRQQASFAPVNLSEITAELASNFRSALENAGLTLKIDCPPLSSPIYVDRDMWEKSFSIFFQTLSNLPFKEKLKSRLVNGKKRFG
ncbi:MAG: GAF domain-containing sensor histidine kinase [Blastocatellia bacterium]|nr:GAF domain-containing sensor histidine kinase [Blastocatellia bacterium]